MESIPLLRFPLLVILNVLSIMCPLELIILSMTSNRSRTIVKSFNKRIKRQYDLWLTVEKDFWVQMRRQLPTGGWSFRITDDKTKDGKLKDYGDSGYKIRKYSENPFSEFKRLCECIQDIFDLRIKRVAFESQHHPHQNRLIIDWLKTRHDTFEYIALWSDSDTEPDLKYLLDTLKTPQRLAIISEITNDFHTELPENLDDLTIWDAKFVKFEQMLRLKARNIQLEETRIISQEINTFLRKWMASECHPDLKSLRIGIENEAAMAAILGDIPHEVLDPIDVRVFEGDPNPVHGGYVIQRIDGKSARLAPYPSWRQMFMRMFIY